MKMKFTFTFIPTALILFLALGVASPVRAEQTSTDELKQAIAALQAELQRIKTEGGASDARLKEIDGASTCWPPATGAHRRGGDGAGGGPGFAPAASNLSGRKRRLDPEAARRLRGPGRRRQPSRQLRQVIYVG
jgi:hypothetical protein